MSFASLKNQVINLENHTVNKLSNYSTYHQDVTSIPSGKELEDADEIQELLLKRENLIKKLESLVAETSSSAKNNNNLVKIQQVARYKEILQDHKKDFARISSLINEGRDRFNLLSSVRSDIEEHRNRSKNKNNNNNNNLDEIEYLNDERQRANQANSVVDRMLEQAFQTRDELMMQNGFLNNANKKIMGTLSHMPGMNELIRKIGTRRKRDSIVMAGVITFCILFFFFLL